MQFVPDDFRCSITGEVMTDPVTTESGHSYEREAIERWLETNSTDPKTNIVISNRLTPNIAQRGAIDQWCEKYKYTERYKPTGRRRRQQPPQNAPSGRVEEMDMCEFMSRVIALGFLVVFFFVWMSFAWSRSSSSPPTKENAKLVDNRAHRLVTRMQSGEPYNISGCHNAHLSCEGNGTCQPSKECKKMLVPTGVTSEGNTTYSWREVCEPVKTVTPPGMCPPINFNQTICEMHKPKPIPQCAPVCSCKSKP